jgi:glycogen synthase
VDNFVKTVINAIHLKHADPGKWNLICRNAEATRFTWQQTAQQYMDILYLPQK